MKSKKVKIRSVDVPTAKPCGLVLNKQELSSIKDIAYTYPDEEFMYLRENEFDTFDPYNKLENLKMLDLSLNNIRSCDFLWGGTLSKESLREAQFPKLRHLYLTGNCIETLEGFSRLDRLETLALSSNAVQSFEGLGDLPNLRVLSLNFNEIRNFKHFPFLPALHSLNLVGNPIDPDKEDTEGHAHFRKMAIALSGEQLVKIDGVPIAEEEVKAADGYRGKIVFCMMEGFVPPIGVDDAAVEKEAEDFLLKMQQRLTHDKPLRLQSIQLVPGRRTPCAPESGKTGYPGPYPPTEGKPIELRVCLQDTRPVSKRKTEIFHSQYIFPVAFKVAGDASEVFVVGSVDEWQDEIPLDRIETENKDGTTSVSFQTNLYLCPGEYEYRYIVDGVEKISEDRKRMSRYGKGTCNYCPVQTNSFPDPEDDERDTILYIRWLRSNSTNGFSLIHDENSLKYTPTAQDVGHCLRAEVLSYLDGQFNSFVFDITCPIEPSTPECTSIEMEGEHEEDRTLFCSASYMGGAEGESLLQWVRVHPDGTQTKLDCHSWEYQCTGDDVGCKIRAVYTPVRQDGSAGAPKSCESNEVTAARPTIDSPQFVGELKAKSDVSIAYTFFRGEEGESRYQWFRLEEDDVSIPLRGETRQTYHTCKDDVGHMLMVHVTPVNTLGVEGATEELITEIIQP
ncbi:187-kDa microtubule-associated protein AIR9 [Diplonema papillatum]|nr:187-kDa microtubule-associated protein AIR9 [Diplonema papillatum]